MKKRHVVGMACLVALVALQAMALADGRGRHKRMFAVPVPAGKKVTIDGKLNDWDLSGQILMYVVSETKAMQGAQFALMYDNEALYLSGVMRDPSPLMNRHDPKVDGHKGWDADACQFRIVVDPKVGYPVNESSFHYRRESKKKDKRDDIVHLTLWHYTDKQEPCLQMHLGMSYRVPRPEWAPHGVVPHDKFEAQYLLAEDKLGCTFEYRIPWDTLGAKQPLKGGDLVAGTVQFNWSRPDGLKTAGGSAWAYDVMGSPGFSFQSTSCWGKIVFSEKGDLPKELVEEGIAPERPLPLTFAYDLPEDSEATVALFDKDNRVARLLVAQGQRLGGTVTERWDGLDDLGKPLAAGEYTWRGLYHQPIKTKFILSVHNSGRPPYKLDNNKGGWGGDHGTPQDVIAAGDTMVLSWSVCESGWGIIRVSLDGKKIWGSKHNAIHMATDGKRLFTAGGHGFNQAPGVKVFDLKDSRPINWGDNQPYLVPPDGGTPETNNVSGLLYHDGIVCVAYRDRNIIGLFDAETGTLNDTMPMDAPGRMVVTPGGGMAAISGQKVSVSRRGPDFVIEDHLDDPVGVTVDAEGILYVANRGKLQNVSVFSADGKYLKSIGKQGGRPRVGRYDKTGLLEPGGIAMDTKGRLWAAETLDAPKRHSVWDVKTGACVNEFFGGSSYFGWAYMDPKHPDEIYCHNVLWNVDLDKGTWSPHSTIWRATKPNMIRAANPGGYAGHFRVMTAKNGHQFGWGMVDYSNMLYMRDGDIFKPIAGTIRVAFGQYGGGLLYPVMKEFYEKHKAGAYLWQDANDDQCVQVEELVVSPAGRGERAFNWIDADLNAWCDAGYIYRPVRFEKDGRPVYDFSKKDDIPFRGRNANATSLWLDPVDDTVYTLNPNNPEQVGFAAWTRDKKLKWGYAGIINWPKALNLGVITPGKLWGLTMPLGVAGDFTGAATYYGPYHIFTRDGLYVAMVMRDGRTGGMGPDITASETITGQLVKPDGMERYFLLAGDQDGRVTEILGLDTVKRLKGGTFTLTEEDVKKAKEALVEYERMKARSQKLVIARGRGSLPSAVKVEKSVDAKRGFAAQVAYDENNLYVAYDVRAEFELANSFADPKLLFKGGNCLDIQIATDPKADPERKRPAPGDVRLIITRREGKAFTVLYRPKVAAFKGEAIVMKSPTGEEPFDVIEVGADVKLEYRKKGDGTGFTATAVIPLKLLGWEPKPNTIIKMDLGYIFGNREGNQAALRAYWINNSFSANVTYDIPNESRLEPHEWGTALVE